MAARIQSLVRSQVSAAVAMAAPATLLGATTARACGVCTHDKMAATYDHDVVQRVLAQHRLVVFSEVESAPVDVVALQRAVTQAAGVETCSVRVSVERAALSFALDPAVQPAKVAVQEVPRVLGELKLSLLHTLPTLPP